MALIKSEILIKLQILMNRGISYTYLPLRLVLLLFLSILCSGCNHNNYFQGYVEGEYSYIASAVSGNLTQLLVDRGDKVVAGQPLFVLDPQPESDKLSQAKSTLAQAEQESLDIQKGQRETILRALNAQRLQVEANLQYAQKTLLRYKELYKQRAIDKASVDQVQSTYDQTLERLKEVEANIAEANLGARENLIKARQEAVSAAAAAVKQAEWALLQKSIRAPVDAEVFDTLYQLGEFVAISSPVLVLLPPDKIKIIFYVPEAVFHQIKIGNLIAVSCDGCKKDYLAKINFISPSAEYTPPVIFSKDSRDKLVFRIEAKPDIKEAIELHPGQPVDVTLK